jgi:hypothetical protein
MSTQKYPHHVRVRVRDDLDGLFAVYDLCKNEFQLNGTGKIYWDVPTGCVRTLLDIANVKHYRARAKALQKERKHAANGVAKVGERQGRSNAKQQEEGSQVQPSLF